MIRFKINGTEIIFEFTFFLMISIIFLFNAEIWFYFAAACLIHELGHIIAVYSHGGNIKKTLFTGFGIIITPNKHKLISLPYEIIILAAGPAANLIMYIFLKIIGCSSEYFLYFNLILGIFNLLPFSKLDGGCLIIKISELIKNSFNASHLLKIISFLIIAAIVLIFIFTRHFYSFFIVILIYSFAELLS